MMPIEELKVICNDCGHIQRCCAPPCEHCQSINVTVVKDHEE